MKPLHSKSLFCFSPINLLTNSRIPRKLFHQISQFSSTPSPQFHSHSHSHSHYPSRRHEEESRLLRVSVWWDFENCTLPAGTNVFRVAQNVTNAVRKNGIKGPVQITAFGDVLQLSRSNQEALSSTGINLTHVPRGGKSSADRSLLVDLMYWVSQNPPPAHLFLISTDGDFANILHRLRLSNYNILLSTSDNAPVVLCSAASIMWHWKSLLRGEDLGGKHFNQPPDGPYGSWYGHYKLPLDNPLAVTAQPGSRADSSLDTGSESKLRPVPKTVVKQIRDVVNSFPEGISIPDLHSELEKTNMSMDKDWYGYRKFSCFILSNSHLLKIQSWGESQLSIRSIASTVNVNPGITTGTVTNDGDLKQDIQGKRNYRENSCSGVEDKTSFPVSSKANFKEPMRNLQESRANVKEPMRNFQESPKQVKESVKKVPETSPLVEKSNGIEIIKESLAKSKELEKVEESQKVVPNPPLVAEKEKCAEVSLNNLEEQNPNSEVGFFRTKWGEWFGGENSAFANNNVEAGDNATLNEDNEKIEDVKKKHVESTSQCPDAIQRSSKVSPTNETVVDENGATSCETTHKSGVTVCESARGSSFLKKMIRWWRGPQSDNASKLSSDNITTTKGDNKEQGVFTNSFWNDMVAFLQTSSGSDLVLQSKSRKEMAWNLQNQGPTVLRYIIDYDCLRLVDLLISDKKWVEEIPSQKYPFKLNLPFESEFHNSNGLKTTFVDAQLQPESQKLPAHGENINVPRTGVPPPAVHEKPIKPRDQILQDCQKLVDYIVKNYPEGYHIRSFKNLFLERYRYSLDVNRLGYPNIGSLLQIMAGIKIDASYIKPEIPLSKVQKIFDQKSTNPSAPSNKSVRSRNLDFPWEELGPVCHDSSKRNEIQRSSRIKKEAVFESVDQNYETLSDDEFSNSQAEKEILAELKGQEQPKKMVKDSSLLRILDTWHNGKGDDNARSSMMNANEMVDGSRKGSLPSSHGPVMQNLASGSNYGRNQESNKSYSFVTDQGMGGLKNSGERSAGPRVPT
ncbi:putative meiosis arrest female protein [Heracleum sosnowskyi]|uniref:Meiosis arrest female protein n=1 Tax=Heracleum sosnowskyi TaxID=360622 RepID=A0AAD8MDI3_9APIA|nr:putative meiosis arrest female protein [Heracleum sosnowskyi]